MTRAHRAAASPSAHSLSPLAALPSACLAPDAANCSSTSACGDCTKAGSGCGFCASSGTCVAGTSLGPAAGECSAWQFSSCGPPAAPEFEGGAPSTVDSGGPAPPPPATCTGKFACADCAEANCVWCGSNDGSGTCVAYGSGGTCNGIATTVSACSSVGCLGAGSSCSVTGTSCCSLNCSYNDPSDPSAGGTMPLMKTRQIIGVAPAPRALPPCRYLQNAQFSSAPRVSPMQPAACLSQTWRCARSIGPRCASSRSKASPRPRRRGRRRGPSDFVAVLDAGHGSGVLIDLVGHRPHGKAYVVEHAEILAVKAPGDDRVYAARTIYMDPGTRRRLRGLERSTGAVSSPPGPSEDASRRRST